MIKGKLTTILALVFAIVFIIFSSMTGGGVGVTYAATSSTIQFDQTDVMSDLDGSVINGKIFSLSDYPYDENGRPAVILFSEYCYSFYTTNRDNYGLYLYIYHPQARQVSIPDHENNKVSFRYGNSADYDYYSLSLLDVSDDDDNAGLFYKFKVDLTETQKTEILNGQTVTREYQLSGIQLATKDGKGLESLEEYTVATLYTYSGYAAGYGMDENADSTLTCTVEGFEEYLGLTVGYTSYVVDGDTQTRDMLMSVYFSVPYDYVADYGDLYAVKATWLKAMSSWGAVLGYEDAYNAILPYVNQTLTSDDYPKYSLITDLELVSASPTSDAYEGDIAYNKYPIDEYNSWDWKVFPYVGINETFNRLDYLYDSSFSVADSADSYDVSPDKILNTIQTYTAAHPDEEKVGGKYAVSMFSEVDGAYTVAEYSTDEEDDFSLEKVTISQSWWQKLLGISTTASTSYDGIKAIQRIYSSDFSDNAGDVDNICKKLYIGSNDYQTIKSYVDTQTADRNGDGNPDNAVYLFRFDIADYYSSEVSICYPSASTGLLGANEFLVASTNGYVFKVPVYLNFDIIQLTFRNSENVATVIPVVMTPVDVVGTAYHPAQTTGDKKDWRELLKLILTIIIVLVVFLLLYPILAPLLGMVVKAIFWVISLPFRLIAGLFKRE